MIKIVASFLFQEAQVDKAMALCQELIDETRKEAGCIQYELAQSNETPAEFAILESWENQQTLDAHSASAHFARLVPALAELCTQPPEVKRYTLRI